MFLCRYVLITDVHCTPLLSDNVICNNCSKLSNFQELENNRLPTCDKQAYSKRLNSLIPELVCLKRLFSNFFTPRSKYNQNYLRKSW